MERKNPHPRAPINLDLSWCQITMLDTPYICSLEDGPRNVPEVFPISGFCVDGHSVHCVALSQHHQLDMLIDWHELYTFREFLRTILLFLSDGVRVSNC